MGVGGDLYNSSLDPIFGAWKKNESFCGPSIAPRRSKAVPALSPITMGQWQADNEQPLSLNPLARIARPPRASLQVIARITCSCAIQKITHVAARATRDNTNSQTKPIEMHLHTSRISLSFAASSSIARKVVLFLRLFWNTKRWWKSNFTVKIV